MTGARGLPGPPGPSVPVPSENSVLGDVTHTGKFIQILAVLVSI